MKYVILTTRHRDIFFGGDVHLFWGPERSGYTAVLQTAGLYDLDEALKIADEDDIPIEISEFGMTESDFGMKFEDVDIVKLYRITDRSKTLIRRNVAYFEKLKKEREGDGA